MILRLLWLFFCVVRNLFCLLPCVFSQVVIPFLCIVTGLHMGWWSTWWRKATRQRLEKYENQPKPVLAPTDLISGGVVSGGNLYDEVPLTSSPEALEAGGVSIKKSHQKDIFLAPALTGLISRGGSHLVLINRKVWEHHWKSMETSLCANAFNIGGLIPGEACKMTPPPRIFQKG